MRLLAIVVAAVSGAATLGGAMCRVGRGQSFAGHHLHAHGHGAHTYVNGRGLNEGRSRQGFSFSGLPTSPSNPLVPVSVLIRNVDLPDPYVLFTQQLPTSVDLLLLRRCISTPKPPHAHLIWTLRWVR